MGAGIRRGGGIREFAGFLRGSRRYLVVAVAACVAETACAFIIPQIIRFTVDNVFGTEPYPQYLTFLPDGAFFAARLYIIALTIAAVALVQAAAMFGMRASAMRAGEKLGKTLRDRLFGHIQRLPFSWHASVQTGDIIQRSTQDVDIIKRFVSEQTAELARTVIMAAGGLGLMFAMYAPLALVTAGFIPLMLGFSSVYYYKISRGFKAADEAEGALTSALQENLTGMRIVRAFGAERREREKFRAHNDLYVTLWSKLGKHLTAYWASGDCFATLQVLSVLVAGAFFAANGSVTTGDFMAFVIYNQMLVWPVRNMGRILGEISKTGISANRIAEILSAEPERASEKSLRPEIRGDVAFEDVVFGYREDGRRVLDGVSFELRAGETLGIMGGTGSGKSTIAHLLTRLYDADEGAVKLDGTDVRDIDTAYLRKNAGLAAQEPFLFSRTIRENIALAAPDASEREIRAAAAVACVDGAVTAFEKGYDTVVGERGVTLSGGQKQRLAIARTLVQKPPVIILDDSLSAVDTRTDKAIRHALDTALSDTTVILISHRITSVMNADKIIILDGGKIAESGTHAELLAKNGVYKRIYDLQTRVDGDGADGANGVDGSGADKSADKSGFEKKEGAK